jgi:SAM-dependent methyltransferase
VNGAATATVLQGYAEDAPELVERYEGLSTETILAPVLDFLPSAPCRILDVGAGTGRDAAWFEGQGHDVVAVEPVSQLRSAGLERHRSARIVWIDDRLPDLEAVVTTGRSFDFILLVGVWQHLPPEDHQRALASLAALLPAGGKLVISIRDGPGAASRPCFPADVEALIAEGDKRRLRLVRKQPAPSIQEANRLAGVTWTWLAFQRGEQPAVR